MNKYQARGPRLLPTPSAAVTINGHGTPRRLAYDWPGGRHSTSYFTGRGATRHRHAKKQARAGARQAAPRPAALPLCCPWAHYHLHGGPHIHVDGGKSAAVCRCACVLLSLPNGSYSPRSCPSAQSSATYLVASGKQ